MATKTSYLIAGALAVGLAGWLLSGQLGGEEVETAENAGGEDASSVAQAAPIAVQVRELVAKPIAREIVINGKTAPVRNVELRAETNGRVIELFGREGAVVKKDAVLVRLDPRDREVQKLEAEALLRQRRI